MYAFINPSSKLILKLKLRYANAANGSTKQRERRYDEKKNMFLVSSGRGSAPSKQLFFVFQAFNCLTGCGWLYIKLKL